MSAPSNFPVEPPSNDQGVFAWDKVSGTWKIMFPLLIVAGVIAGSVIFGGMVTFQNGITISNKQGIVYNGHFTNFTNQSGTILYANGSASQLSANVRAISAGTNISINGSTGTVSISATGGSLSYNVTSTSSTPTTPNKAGFMIILVNASSGSRTVILPAISTITTNGFFTVIKVDSSANIVHVNRTGTDHIEGGIIFKNLQAQNSKITVQPSTLANGTGWYWDIGSGNQ